MRLLRLIGLGLASILFYISLSTFVILAPLSQKLTDPTTIKIWLAESGTYEHLIPSISHQLATEKRTNNGQGISTEELTQAFSEALPTSTLRTYGEEIIDATYEWLRGDSPIPEFRISLMTHRTELEKSFSGLIQKRLSGAPTCTGSINEQNGDIQENLCRPRGLSAEQAADMYASQLFEEGGAFANSTLDSKELLKDSGDLSNHPAIRIYSLLGTVPIVTLVVALFSALLAILISRPMLRGTTVITRRALTVGFIVSLGATVFAFILPKVLLGDRLGQTEAPTDIVGLIRPLVSDISQDLSFAVYVYSIPLFIVSMIVFIILWVYGRKSNSGIDSTHEGAANSRR